MDQQTSKCIHYFNVESPRETWSLAVCYKCDKIDAFLNWNPTKFGNSVFVGNTGKREFLKSRGVKYWETYTIEKKKEVIQTVEKLGIHKTARLLEIPISTVGLWAKGQSIHIKNSDKYTPHFKLSAIGYYLKERNFKKVARILGVPRSTLQSWTKKAFKQTRTPHVNESSPKISNY